jgi:HD domain
VQAHRFNAVVDASESGYGALVLDRLARHTCGVTEADAGGVIVLDRRDPEVAFAAAGCGIAIERTGERFPLEPGVLRDVIATARPKRLSGGVELERLTGDVRGPASGACVAMSWADEVRGAVWAAAVPGPAFDERRVELLGEMARLTATAIEHAENHQRLEASAETGVEALAAAIEMRDGYTGEHSADVVSLAVEVGRALRLDAPGLVELRCAARLHDVGKIGVPDGILRKPGPLTHDEWITMRRHAPDGSTLLARVPGLEAVAAIVRFHHERWDGAGYPDRLAAAQIPVASRIVAGCDAFRAMTADRPYRRAMTTDDALRELSRCAGTQFDAAVVDALARIVRAGAPVRGAGAG